MPTAAGCLHMSVCLAWQKHTASRRGIVILLIHSVLLPAALSTAVTSVHSHIGNISEGYPRSTLYDDPWVQHNIVLTYAPETTRDGLGAQAFRLLGIYALSKALNVQYLHAQPECVGHIGSLPHYQGRECTSKMSLIDWQKLHRVQRVLSLPSSAGLSSASVSSWQEQRLDNAVLTWEALHNVTEAALQQHRPTVIKLARVQALLCQHPDVFLSVPELRPVLLPVEVQAKPWLLKGIRLVVHMRRGDITQNTRHLQRVLPLAYYQRVLEQLTQALSAAGRDVLIECYTERPTTAQGRKELQALRSTFPSITLLVDTDDLWNWQQMATADVLVLSLSTYAVVPSLLNPNALIIAPNPVDLKGMPMSAMRMRHWFSTQDHSGDLQPEVLQQVQARFGNSQQAIEKLLRSVPAPAM